MKLTRRFSPLNMLLLSINGMIGSAWLFAPWYAAKITGASAIYAWLIGGVGTVLIALTFAEISTLFPVAGGTTRLPLLSHGAVTSFLMGWISWLSCVTMAPIEVQSTLQYAATYFPSLIHIVNGIPVLSGFGLICATLIMALLCVINVGSFQAITKFNLILFLFKVIVIGLTILFLIKTAFHPMNFFGVNNGLTSINWQTVLTAVAGGGIAFAFTGFKHGVELAGETKNSQVAIPLAIVGSVIFCLIIYLGLQTAFIGALNPALLEGGWKNLSFTHEVGPFVGLAAILGIMWLVKLLYIDAAISPLGAGFVYVTSTSRIIYAMSKNGYLPKIFSSVNKKHFPVWAIGLNFFIGIFLFLPLSGWQNMVNFLVSAVVISYAMGPIALVCFRKQLPNEKRGFRLPFAQPLCLLAFYFCNLISYWTGWSTVSKLAIAIIIGCCFFSIGFIRNSWDKNQLGLKAAFWLFPYLGGLIVISYLGSFGGKGIILFGWDFLIIGIFSVIIFYLAIALRIEKISSHVFSTEIDEAKDISTKGAIKLTD